MFYALLHRKTDPGIFNDLDDQSADNYTYDLAGNLITNQQAGITTPMTWSVYGKLLTIIEAGDNF